MAEDLPLPGEREPSPGVACAPEVAAPCAAGGGPPAVRRCRSRGLVRPVPKTATPPQPQSTKLGVGEATHEGIHPVHGKHLNFECERPSYVRRMTSTSS